MYLNLLTMEQKKNLLMLDFDKSFEPVSIDEGDEYFPNGIFVFNITKMLKYIKENRNDIECGNISVLHYRDESFNINEGYLEFVDISSPVILVEICPGIYNLIDGHHRIEKAFRTGVESIPAYMLKPAQYAAFLTTTKAYSSYIEYWNSKIADGYHPVK